MVTTRGQGKKATGEASSSASTPTNNVTEGTSKAPAKPKNEAGKKATTGRNIFKKASVTHKGTSEVVVDVVDFLSPTNSVGPPIAAHPARDNAALAPARQGPTYRAASTDPIGLCNADAECYANVSITMLMNLTPFIGFLEQHGSAPRYYGEGNFAEQDILARLNDIAVEYWSADRRGKQARLDAVATPFKHWLVDVARTGVYDGTNPWTPNQRGQEDASECLDKILEIASMQLATFDLNGADTLEALVQPIFQHRWACRGIGRTCPNIERVRILRGQNDPFQRFLVLELPPFAPGAKTLDDCIRIFMNEQTNMRTCALCMNLYTPTNPKGRQDGVGREWNRIREAPECLIMKLNRSKLNGKKLWKNMANVSIPETVDLTQYLEADDQAAGITARYRLDVVVYHGGTGIRSGHYISHVRNHADPTRWHRLNDQKKTDELFAEAVDDRSKSRNQQSTVYMLGFTKIHDSAEHNTSAGGTTAKGSQGTGSKNNDSDRAGPGSNGFKDGNSVDNEPKNPIGKTSRAAQVQGDEVATFTASLFATGDGQRPFHTVTQDIKLGFNVGRRGTIPIKVTLDLPDSRHLYLKKLIGDSKQYVLAPRRQTKPVQNPGSDADVKYPKLSLVADDNNADKKLDSKGTKHKQSENPGNEKARPNKTQRFWDDCR